MDGGCVAYELGECLADDVALRVARGKLAETFEVGDCRVWTAEVLVEGFAADASLSSRMVLLVQNAQGYLNLSELLARGHTQNTGKAQVLLRKAWLQ